MAILSACTSSSDSLYPSPDRIRVNQLGYYPDAPKKAVVVMPVKATGFEILDTQSKEVVY